MQPWRPLNYPVQMNIRVSPELVAWLEAKAEQERLSIGGYARKILKEAAQRDLVGAEESASV
jgi:predicted HicB family RNase H-like nuclease